MLSAVSVVPVLGDFVGKGGKVVRGGVRAADATRSGGVYGMTVYDTIAEVGRTKRGFPRIAENLRQYRDVEGLGYVWLKTDLTVAGTRKWEQMLIDDMGLESLPWNKINGIAPKNRAKYGLPPTRRK